ncbi:hypothetical protein TcBrA4_0049830 [Trypanosoma cruzi]|nr:hypothetical protein TcBrA4_0049830 [Trypanosoma cruzi]
MTVFFAPAWACPRAVPSVRKRPANSTTAAVSVSSRPRLAWPRSLVTRVSSPPAEKSAFPRRRRLFECTPQRRRRSRRSGVTDPEAAAKNTRGSRRCAYDGRLPGLSGRGDAASHLRTTRGSVGGPGDTPFGVLKYKAKSPTGDRRCGVEVGAFFPHSRGSREPAVFPSRGRAVAAQVRVLERTCFTMLAGVRAAVFV